MALTDKQLMAFIRAGLERTHRNADITQGVTDNELFVTIGGASWRLVANQIPTHRQPATLPLVAPTPEPARPA